MFALAAILEALTPHDRTESFLIKELFAFHKIQIREALQKGLEDGLIIAIPYAGQIYYQSTERGRSFLIACVANARTKN